MTEERITAYLLNELSEREAEEFEEQCFAQPEWPEVELEAAEDDLIQAYVKNELSDERRRSFEENYMTTEARKERVLIARSFLRVGCVATAPAADPDKEIAPVDPVKPTFWQKLVTFWNPQPAPTGAFLPRFAGVVVAIGLTAILALVAMQYRTPRTFADINLAMRYDNRATSSEVPKVKLPLAEDALRISLNLPEPARAGTTYRVQWEDLKGPVDDLKIDKQDANSLTVIIPARDLKPGQYLLKLFQKTGDGSQQPVEGNYQFIVE